MKRLKVLRLFSNSQKIKYFETIEKNFKLKLLQRHKDIMLRKELKTDNLFCETSSLGAFAAEKRLIGADSIIENLIPLRNVKIKNAAKSSGAGKTPTSKQITLQKKATHKKPVCDWKVHSHAKFGSGHFLKFQLDVKYLLKHRIGDQFQNISAFMRRFLIINN